MILYYALPPKTRLPWTVAAVVAGVLLNGLLNTLNGALSLPIFLDSIFTIMVTATFGLWPGLVVGILTNAFMELVNGFPGYLMPFAFVNAITAFVTYFAVRKDAFNTVVGAFWTMVILAFTNALAGAFIVTIVFGGITNEPVDNIVRAFYITGQSIFSSAFLARILVNIVDKGIAVAITLPLYRYLLRRKAELEPNRDFPGSDTETG